MSFFRSENHIIKSINFWQNLMEIKVKINAKEKFVKVSSSLYSM
jgi:hypothetical protein